MLALIKPAARAARHWAWVPEPSLGVLSSSRGYREAAAWRGRVCPHTCCSWDKCLFSVYNSFSGSLLSLCLFSLSPLISLSQPPISATPFHHLPVPIISSLPSRDPGQSVLCGLWAAHPLCQAPGSCLLPSGCLECDCLQSGWLSEHSSLSSHVLGSWRL